MFDTHMLVLFALPFIIRMLAVTRIAFLFLGSCQLKFSGHVLFLFVHQPASHPDRTLRAHAHCHFDQRLYVRVCVCEAEFAFCCICTCSWLFASVFFSVCNLLFICARLYTCICDIVDMCLHTATYTRTHMHTCQTGHHMRLNCCCCTSVQGTPGKPRHWPLARGAVVSLELDFVHLAKTGAVHNKRYHIRSQFSLTHSAHLDQLPTVSPHLQHGLSSTVFSHLDLVHDNICSSIASHRVHEVVVDSPLGCSMFFRYASVCGLAIAPAFAVSFCCSVCVCI